MRPIKNQTSRGLLMLAGALPVTEGTKPVIDLLSTYSQETLQLEEELYALRTQVATYEQHQRHQS